MLLDGKVVLVSGVGHGLGRAICLALLREGAAVVAGDTDERSLTDLRAAATASSAAAADRLRTQCTDITETSQCEALAHEALGAFGRVDVLVNDAYHGGDFLPFADADLDVWRQVADVNIWGTLRMTRAALPHLAEHGDGRVIMVVTQGVEWVQQGFGAYTGTKAAVAHYVKLLASELGPRGVRVNGVFPGPMWGPALQGHLQSLANGRGVSLDAIYDEWAQETALHHLVTPDEVAGSVVFLASSLARWITGQALYVNAGQWFH